MKPGGQRQVKAPMVLTQKNWQLCCLEVHSSRSVAQMVPGLRPGPSWDRELPRGTILEMVPYAMQWEGGEIVQDMPWASPGGSDEALQGMREGHHLCRSCRPPPAGSRGGRHTGSCLLCFCRGRCTAWGSGCTHPHLEGMAAYRRIEWTLPGAQGLGSLP